MISAITTITLWLGMSVANSSVVPYVHDPTTPMAISENIVKGEYKYKDIDFKPFDLQGVSEEFKENMVKGIISTYNNSPDLSKPFAVFDGMAKERPDRPEGFFLKASLYFSIYQVKPEKAIFDSLKYYSEKAIDITKGLHKKNPDNKYFNFYLGAAYGNMGLYYLKAGSYWSAYRNGKKGVSYLEKALEIDPDFGDAQLGIGIFNYYASVLPKSIKPLMWIVGMSGDRRKGLTYMESALSRSYLSKVEAHDFLARIYGQYEGKTDDTLSFLKGLHEQFADNPYYHHNYARFTYENGDYLEAKRLFERFMEKKNLTYSFYSRNGHYYLGVIAHQLGEYDESNRHMQSVLTAFKKLPENLERSANHIMGLNFEYQNQREKALAYYNKALKIKSKIGTNDIKKRIKNPISVHELRKKKHEALIYNGNDGIAMTEITRAIEQVDTEQLKNDRELGFFHQSYKRQLADLYLKSGEWAKSKTVFDSITYKSIRNDDREKAQYYLLGSELCHNLNLNKLAEKYIKEASDIDEKNLSVVHLRKNLYLQQKIFGDIKYR